MSDVQAGKVACFPSPCLNLPITCLTKFPIEPIYLVKVDEQQESTHFDKINAELKMFSYKLSQKHRDPVLVTKTVCDDVYKGMTTQGQDKKFINDPNVVMTDFVKKYKYDKATIISKRGI